MKIVWFVDNKFRELYGLHDLKKIFQKTTLNFIYSFYQSGNQHLISLILI